MSGRRWLGACGAFGAVLSLSLSISAVPAPAIAVQEAPVHRPAAAQRATDSALPAAAGRIVEQMTSAERAATVVMGHIPTTDPATLSGYMGSGLGGFILMGANVPDSEQELRTVTSALAVDPVLPPLIAVDQEGGQVSRLGWDDFAGPGTLKEEPAANSVTASAARAALVARAGITVNFGIVADTTSDRSSFIFGRSLGADPQGAADRVAAAVTAQEPFVAATLKHFPGHGAAPGDSHQLIPSTTESLDQWRTTDAVPFAAGIDAGASLLMFGHLAYTSVDAAPASLSARWHEIAREDLGFDGVIVTDDLGMLQSTGIAAYADPVANAVAAITAGNDLVLAVVHSTPETAGQMAAGIAAAVDSGALPAERLQDAAERVVTLRLRIAAAGPGWTPCAECVPAE
jgi:beta-N-acetylhexosaminidase